jgi:hypothetical protein
MSKPETTISQMIAWLEGQIAFKPNHPDWEIITAIIERLEEDEGQPISNERLKAIVDQIPLKEAP